MITPSKNTIKTNAKFADEVYKWFMNRKHGIGSCCGVELDRYYTKKENCDLGNRILDGYCMPTPVIPVPPVCPVECVEGSYATAYFNLLSLAYPIITVDPPASSINFQIFNITALTFNIDNRNVVYAFSDPATLEPFITTVNDIYSANSIPLTLSFAESIPGAMGYGLVLTSNDKTDVYNDLVFSIQLINLGEPGSYYDFNLDSTMNGGVISTC